MAALAQAPVPGCPRHQGKGFVYVCKSCNDQLICMECVTGSHNGHTLGKLTEYVESQKREIQQYVDKLSKVDIPKVEEDIRENETNGGQYQAAIRDIKRQGEKMKDDIDRNIDMLVNMCTELEKLNATISEKNKTALNKHLNKDLKPKLHRTRGVLASGTTADVTILAREIRNTSIVPPTLRKLQKVEFKSGTISKELLEHMLGKILVDGEDQSCKPITAPVILNKITPSFDYNTCQAHLTGDEAWLSFWDSDRVYRVDTKGRVKEKIQCKVKVDSISISPTTGRVWFCVCDDRSIREITTGGDNVKRFNVTDTPRSLCMTSDDMVVVGMEGGIQLFTTDGRVVSSRAGGPCRQVAVLPHQITSCKQTGDVAVVDSDGVSYDSYMAGKGPDKQPYVIVMDKHLNLKFHCKDISATNPIRSSTQSSKFYPYDVCFDGAGDVLVTEWITKSVLLIDRNTGHCMRTVYTSDGVEPLCISLHEDGTFWVGHRDRKIKIFQYIRQVTV
ncbi:uncharacterized protein LOC132553730 [Ylistrum balloti]|uniref:uncharacterized protein LOC132553730 n=1 Tax=Ylistrum balloti TaxID=509963 RepID=UPI0029059DDB|nr:uncharacterized protein LOC132553730 [Ylistrum balloti]